MIPSILWQTAKTVDDCNTRLIKTWVLKNPSLDYRFMDDNACKNFIRDNFSDEVFVVYNSLPLGIMRADMWRLAVMYVHGGIYADTDTECIKCIDELLKDKDTVICHEHETGSFISNYFFAAKPKHQLFKDAIDEMVRNFHIAFDINSKLLVQNFGMSSFQVAFNKYNIELTSLSEINSYVKHRCHGTWRQHEKDYISKSTMKNITFFTTFNQNGYDLYGKTWIKTFIENVAPKSPNIKALIYAHNVSNLKCNHPQITVLDYDECIPKHNEWKTDFLNRNSYSDYVKNSTIRFSHKGFVIQHALDSIKDGYAIWLDGDCVMHDASYDEFPANLLSDCAIACQLEHTGMNAHHIESGVLLFDIENPDIEKFKQAFKFNYEVDQVLTMGEPYDGFIVYKSIVNSGIQFNNLNEKYGIGGIQSCPTLTFLHPEISVRFTHNIGLTGKESYAQWDDVKYNDPIFRQLASVAKLSPLQEKVRSLKAKKKLIQR